MKNFFIFLIVLNINIFVHSQSLEIEGKIDSLLLQMTLQEKVSYIGGTNVYYLSGIPRLKIPEIKTADGPMGIRANGKSTAFPAIIALASTWNRDLAFKIGDAIGKECRAKRIGFLLAPGVNIYRAPMCGRNFEYIGEDPFLAAEMVVPYVKGVQKNKVVATVKHFVANNQEYDRFSVSSNVDERTLREIYFPAFKAAVQKGGALAVMTAYNPLNHLYCSENCFLINQVLKREWGFQGLVMSDWDIAVHSTKAITAGLDLEMSKAVYMSAENIMSEIESGKLDERIINDKVRRILRTCLTMNLFNMDKADTSVGWDAHHNVALQVAHEGIVLLKNENNILPLNPQKIKRIAVLGPTAINTPVGGGGAAYVTPYRHINFFDAIRQKFEPKIKVKFFSSNRYPPMGKMIKNSKFYLDSISTKSGLHVEFFDNISLTPPTVSKRIDQKIDFNFGAYPPAKGLKKFKYSARWHGYIKPEKSGKYVFGTVSDDGVKVYLDGKLIIENWSDHAPEQNFYETELQADRFYSITVEYYQNEYGASLRFGYALIDNTPLEKKLAQIKNYDAAIVCVGFNRYLEGEGHDRPFSLPEEQNELIKKVSELNDNTIVLLTAGGGIDFMPWIKKVKAILHTFYLGQVGGEPVANILLGTVNPSGKIPFTIEKRWEDAAAYDHYYPSGEKQPIYSANFSKNPKAVQYQEEIFVGYRHFDKYGIVPLFPFGFGLSYTRFEYGNLKLSTTTISPDGKLQLSCVITNIGKMVGSEVVQLYLHKEVDIVTPEKELKGFQKIELQPGESKTIVFEISPEHLQVFDPVKNRWEVKPGKYLVLIGSSSRDIRLKEGFLVKPSLSRRNLKKNSKSVIYIQSKIHQL